MRNFSVIFRRQVSEFRDVVSEIFNVYISLLFVVPSIIYLAIIVLLGGRFPLALRVASSELRGSATGIIPPNPSTPP